VRLSVIDIGPLQAPGRGTVVCLHGAAGTADQSAFERLSDPIYYADEWGTDGRQVKVTPTGKPFIAARGKTKKGFSAAISARCLQTNR